MIEHIILALSLLANFAFGLMLAGAIIYKNDIKYGIPDKYFTKGDH